MKQKIIGFIRTETAQAIGFVFVIGLIIWAVGCESMVTSLTDPVKKISRDQLTAEIEIFNADIESRIKEFAARAGSAYDSLDKQDASRRAFFDALAIYAQTGSLNPAGVVAAIVGILGVSAVADNVRKRGEIVSLKKKNGGSA